MEFKFGKCLLVLICTFIDLNIITVSFDKLYSTKLLLSKTCYKYFLILSDPYGSPKRDSNLGRSRIAVSEDCKARVIRVIIIIML